MVLSVLLPLLALAIPLFTAAVVGRIVPDHDRHLLAVLAAAMAAVAGYYFLVSLVRAHVLLHLRTHLDRQLTTGFVRHLTDLPYAFFLSRSAGDLMMRLQLSPYSPSGVRREIGARPYFCTSMTLSTVMSSSAASSPRGWLPAQVLQHLPQRLALAC